MPFAVAECERARRDFPALNKTTATGERVAYFDGPGGTQTPRAVTEAIVACYESRNANFDGMFQTSLDITEAVQQVRATVADFLGAEDAACISFGANMTSLNFSLSHALGRSLRENDEVLITALDHEANRGPWLGLAERGVRVREIAMTSNGMIDWDHFERLIGDRPRVVAMTLASNALGTVPDLSRAVQAAHDIGAVVVLDAVHFAAHFPVDVLALDADFLLCSAYKFYGPHIGILYAKTGLLDTLATDQLTTQKSGAPYRIETGTLNYAAIEGVGAAVEYLASWGAGIDRRAKLTEAMTAIGDYEHRLAKQYFDGLRNIDGVRYFGPDFEGARRAPTISIAIAQLTPQQVAARANDFGLQLWHGHFYARRVIEELGLTARGGLLRTGISMYNTSEEVERLLGFLATLN
ncbi:MAG: cysteine desulfurase-like protein [Pseudomonadota bacterium]